MLHIGNLPAQHLADRFGTPLYVYDAAIIRRQIDRLRRAFTGIPFQPFYAMKANSALAILQMINDAGFGADAVSPGEIFLAQHGGFTPDRIWFTCSNVSDDDLLTIPDPRIVVNVNSMAEIDRVLAHDLDNPIALRINPDVGAGHHHDVVTAGGGVKFGIDLAEVDAARVTIETAGKTIVGIHAHIGSGVDTIDPLLASARTLLELSRAFSALRFINFGGGISVPYAPGEKEFPIDDYGAALASLAGDELRARSLTAILEPGRYVVAESGFLLARATTKRISGGAWWLGVDTGFNHLVRPSKYGAYHHIVNASRTPDSHEDLIVAGNLCESGDVFTRSSDGTPITRSIERMEIGDVMAFCTAGAYGFSMASHYNARLLPPEVLVDGNHVTLIRARQDFGDLLRGQR
jgi:diaminopimelate decarboxylase